MSGESDTHSEDAGSVGRRAVVIETMRALWAFGLGAVLTVIVGAGIYLVGPERLGLPFEVVLWLFLFLPAVLYVYDRRHSRDLVIADVGVRIVRPLAVIYRLFRAGGP